jgi:putative transposase
MKPIFNIEAACRLLGYKRQAFYKKAVLKTSKQELIEKILPTVLATRAASPSKGCRALYEKYGEYWPIGRDASISLLMQAGLQVRFPKHYRKATQSGCRPFANLLVNKLVKTINQVWQADMAYYHHGKKNYYTIYITDVYSQEIVGYGAYETNHAANYAQVLAKAIRAQAADLSQLIHHSDGGKQYESTLYRNLCEKHGITQSMCMFSYENPYAEKTNDLMNNGYLNQWKPPTLNKLRKMQVKAVVDHNQNSRKKKLGRKSPNEFNEWMKIHGNQQPYSLQLKPLYPTQARNNGIG